MAKGVTVSVEGLREVDAALGDLGKVLGKGTAAKNKGKDLTGWKAVDSALFGTKGAISKIYDAGGKS